MNEFLHKTWTYLLDVGIATFDQLFVLLAPLILLSFLMNLIARKNEELSYKVMGQKVYLYIFGWLGTSVHELGHAIFALLFAHKISEIKLFTPNSSKSLGHVKHSYTKGNPYQTLGNFFIGIGPVLLGALLLWLITLLLFDLNIFNLAEKFEVVFNLQLFTSFDGIKAAALNIVKGIWEFMEIVVANRSDYAWKMILFCFLFYSIGSSITLSNSDVKGAFSGFLYFLLLLLVFNLATIWKRDFLIELFNNANRFFSGFYYLILMSLVINLAFVIVLIFLNLLLSVFHKGKK